MGLKTILSLTFPEKEIYLINEDYSDYVAFLGKEDEDIDESLYSDALCIVLDTGSADRISNSKYSLCRETVKIDHHIVAEPYGDVCWIEEQRSSTCEMIAGFYLAFRDELRINLFAATAIYTGMVTDSGRFRFRYFFSRCYSRQYNLACIYRTRRRYDTRPSAFALCHGK